MYACMDACKYVCVRVYRCMYIFTHVYTPAQREGGRVNITCHGKDKFRDFCLILILFTVQSFPRHPYFSFYRIPTNKVNKIPFPSAIQWTRVVRGEARGRKGKGGKWNERRKGGKAGVVPRAKSPWHWRALVRVSVAARRLSFDCQMMHFDTRLTFRVRVCFASGEAVLGWLPSWQIPLLVFFFYFSSSYPF